MPGQHKGVSNQCTNQQILTRETQVNDTYRQIIPGMSE